MTRRHFHCAVCGERVHRKHRGHAWQLERLGLDAETCSMCIERLARPVTDLALLTNAGRVLLGI